MRPKTQEIDQELVREWFQLEEEVHDRLQRGASLPEDNRFYRAGQLIVFPAFGNPHSWDIVHFGGDPFSLFWSCWRNDKDKKVFESRESRNKHPTPFIPTIEVVPVPVVSKVLRDLLTPFRRLRVPLSLINPRTCGIDGVSFELSFGGDLGGGCRIIWWCDLPEEWQPLKPLIQRMLQVFQSELCKCRPEEKLPSGKWL